MAPIGKRSKLWNYFEELKHSLVMCTNCKKEIHIPNPKRPTTILRKHLNGHGIFPDNDIFTLPEDLRQYYSELSGYKAKCNDCDKVLSFLTNRAYLRKHLKTHSARIQSLDETITMAPIEECSKMWYYFEELKPSLVKCRKCKKEIHISVPTRFRTLILRAHLSNHGIFPENDTRTLPDDLRTKKRSKLWDYFEELKPSLVKCRRCKKEIQIPDPTRHIKIFRAHLNRHGIFLENNTLTLPNDLKQYYSQLSGYKAKCNDCGQTVSFLNRYVHLRIHLKRHSTRIQRGMFKMASTKKCSKLWDYFEKLKPSLAKCTNCKKEIHIRDLTSVTRIFRAHLSGHGIFLENDTFTLPDDLKQYYSELPGYKARCNDCGQTVSFLYDKRNLRRHLIKHSVKIQRWNKAITMAPIGKRSKLWNYFEELKPSLAMCTKCKKEIHIRDPASTTRIFRAHLSGHAIFPDSAIHKLPDNLRQHYSELPGYKARCNECGQTVSFLACKNNLRQHLIRHFTRTQSRDKEITMTPIRKRSKLWNYFEELKPLLVKCTKCKKEIHICDPASATRLFRTHLNEHAIFLENDTRTLPDDLRQYYSELPGHKARCNNCGQTVSFLNRYDRLRLHLKRHSIRKFIGDS